MEDSPQQRRLKRKLDRQERYPWLLLTKTFQTATSAQVLLVALIGAVATTAGWRLLDSWTLSADDKSDYAQLDLNSRYFGKWPGARSSAVYPCQCAWSDTVMADVGYPPDDVLLAMPYRIVAPVVGVLTFDGTSRPRLYYLLGGFQLPASFTALRVVKHDNKIGTGGRLKALFDHFPWCQQIA